MCLNGVDIGGANAVLALSTRRIVSRQMQVSYVVQSIDVWLQRKVSHVGSPPWRPGLFPREDHVAKVVGQVSLRVRGFSPVRTTFFVGHWTRWRPHRQLHGRGAMVGYSQVAEALRPRDVTCFRRLMFYR
jgi:hypothetical protein